MQIDGQKVKADLFDRVRFEKRLDLLERNEIALLIHAILRLDQLEQRSSFRLHVDFLGIVQIVETTIGQKAVQIGAVLDE